MQKSLINQGFSGISVPITSTNFKTASLWPLRYPSVYELPFGRFHRIFNFFRNIFRNAVFGCFRSARKVSVYKAFPRFCDLCARKFSRQPRYDHFDMPPYEFVKMIWLNDLIILSQRISFVKYNFLLYSIFSRSQAKDTATQLRCLSCYPITPARLSRSERALWLSRA